MSLVTKFDGIDAGKIKDVFKELIISYLTPAFGSISKRDFDILLFMKLQDLGVIDKNPEIYELVSNLKVTRAKARNLLYEAKLRVSSEENLDEELKQLLISPIFLKENDKICIEVENPYLKDHLRSKLKKINHITDGSFSKELVKLTVEAYLALFNLYLPDKSERKIIKALVDVGAKKDTSFTGIMIAILRKLGKKFAGEAGGEIAGSFGKYLEPIIYGNVDSIKEVFSNFFEEEESK